MIFAILGASMMQLRTSLRRWDDLTPLVIVPISTTLFLTTLRMAHRSDLAIAGVLASYIIAVWTMAIVVGGDIIDDERYFGTLGIGLVTPTTLEWVIVGRALSIGAIGFIALIESALIARLGFAVPLPISDVPLFVAALLLLYIAVSGLAYFVAGAFVLARSARSFQNAATYPAYVLGGVLAPLQRWPLWIRVLGRCFFLSWAMELLRQALRITPPGPVAGELTVLVGLVGVTWVAGLCMLKVALGRIRQTGQVDDV